MLKRWAAWPQAVRWQAVIAAVVLGLAIVYVLFVPVADWLAHHDIGSATGSLQETAVDNARGRLLTLGAGLLAAGALLFTARSFGLSREGQVTERYTKAIEQLGSEKLDVRIGGIYALERIALDSARDHPTIIEVLTTFIREHSREAWEPADYNGPLEYQPPRPDIQAATTVIARRDHRRDIRHLDLAGANLNYAKLTRINFAHANLSRAKLHDAKVSLADLTGADLTGADLTNATFIIACLSGADLTEANLTGTGLTQVNFVRAELARAELARAELVSTSLNGANLALANVAHADLSDADLSGANLTGTNLSGAELPSNLDNVDLARAELTDAKMHPGKIPAGWELNAAGRLIRKQRGSTGSADG